MDMKSVKPCQDCSWRVGENCGHPSAVRTTYRFTGRYGSRISEHALLTLERARANGSQCGLSGSLWRREAWLEGVA